MNTKLLMTFPVSATSHTLADYRARGGYSALQKALTQMTPQQVTAEVTASGIQGRGGAAFPAGRKWNVVNLRDGQPHYLCANADEGEPGTFKDRWILEHAPHLLIESMLIAAYALEVRTDDGENVTIALDAANSVITRQDANAADATARPMTDAIFTDLSFTFLDASRTETATSELVSYIQVQVTARSRGLNPYTKQFTTSMLGTEVRVRTR